VRITLSNSELRKRDLKDFTAVLCSFLHYRKPPNCEERFVTHSLYIAVDVPAKEINYSQLLPLLPPEIHDIRPR